MYTYLKNNISPYTLLFLLGGIVGVCVAWPVESWVFNSVNFKIQDTLWGEIGIATFEELLKFIPLVLVLKYTKNWTPKKIILCAIAVGAGFGFMETIVYTARFYYMQGSYGLGWIVIGLIISRAMHMIYALAPALMIAYTNKKVWVFIGLVMGISLHALQNLTF